MAESTGEMPAALAARLESYKAAKDKTPEELKAELDAKMDRAEQKHDALLKETQESAHSEVAKAKSIVAEHESKSEAPATDSPTKGAEIARD